MMIQTMERIESIRNVKQFISLVGDVNDSFASVTQGRCSSSTPVRAKDYYKWPTLFPSASGLGQVVQGLDTL
jgi:hypothetical protein